jgi:hypothetical protein
MFLECLRGGESLSLLLTATLSWEILYIMTRHLILKFTPCFVHIFKLIFLLYFFFLFFFLFRIAIQWHNLQTVEVGNYCGESLSLLLTATLSWEILYIMTRRASLRRSSRLRHFRCCSMSPTLDVLRCLLVIYLALHDKVAVSKSDRLSPPLRHSRNMRSQSYQVPLCRTQQRKASFFPRTTVDSSAEWFSRVIQDCHYHISSLNSLPVLYIFLNLFSYCTFFMGDFIHHDKACIFTSIFEAAPF